jgi:hypothetical protein
MTNPSRPVVDVPVFVGELGDIPRLIKLSGDSLLSKAASANLAYQFGWKPLISDLSKLCQFGDVMSKRQNELKGLYTSGLSCTRDLNQLSHSQSTPTGITSWEAWKLTGSASLMSTQRVWGHVKWKPTTLPPATDAEMIALTRRAVLGLTIDLSTGWELIPFSWLADWGSNVGNWLMANRNIVPASWYDLCIMRHKEWTWQHHTDSLTPPSFTMEGEPSFSSEVKSRTPISSIFLEADLQVLTLKQMSILGSISVLRGRR